MFGKTKKARHERYTVGKPNTYNCA